MAICPKQARMLNLSNNQTHDATEKCVKMLIIRYHLDTAKCFLANVAKFYVFKVNNRHQ